MPRNYHLKPPKPASITVRATGTVFFNKSALILLDLQHLQQIGITRRNGQWQIRLNDTEGGFRVSVRGFGSSQGNWPRLTKKLFADAPKGTKKMKLQIRKTSKKGVFALDMPPAPDQQAEAAPRTHYIAPKAPHVHLPKTA